MMMSFQPFQLVVQASGETTLITAGMPGPAGAIGATGATGPAGAAGVGVPVGGTAGQALVKNSGTNYDTAWQTVPTVGVIIQDAATQTNSTWSSTKIQAQLDTKAATTHNHSTLYAPIASGVPTGGTAGQVLVKTSNVDYADAWASLINTVDEFDITGVSWSTGTPSTTAVLKGRYVEMGSLVALSVRLDYGTTAVTNLLCTIPMNGQFPLALEFSGVDTANEIITVGLGVITPSETSINTTTSAFVCIRRNGANNGQEIYVRAPGLAAYRFVSCMLLYRKA